MEVRKPRVTVPFLCIYNQFFPCVMISVNICVFYNLQDNLYIILKWLCINAVTSIYVKKKYLIECFMVDFHLIFCTILCKN